MANRAPHKSEKAKRRPFWIVVLLLVTALGMPLGCQNLRSLPEGISVLGTPAPANEIHFLADQTWIDDEGERQVSQQIFDRLLSNIDEARKLVVIDMFLFNAMQGEVREETRPLAEELTTKLIAHKQGWPDTEIIVITDPVNTVYGGMPAPHLDALHSAGIQVVMSPLSVLHDSNPSYSFFWRLFFRWMGNHEGGTTAPNPLGEGKVTLRSYLTLLNFKANHRKVMISDRDGDLIGFVTSANPHDGSSAHRNIALEFNGPAAYDLLQSELAVLKLAESDIDVYWTKPVRTDADATVQLLTEGKIREALLESINQSSAGDSINIQIFYLSERQIIRALKSAQQRGVQIRMILDPNKDAFGREKNGIPNRQVADELHRSGIPIRWCDTHGEQCHEKIFIYHGRTGPSTIILGSANFTRRNLADLNLETDVRLVASKEHSAIQSAQAHFDESWGNLNARQVSVDYTHYAERSTFKTWIYRFMEASGWSTF